MCLILIHPLNYFFMLFIQIATYASKVEGGVMVVRIHCASGTEGY